jgi:hypothetical protein
VGSNPGTVYWMELSYKASYYIEKKENKCESHGLVVKVLGTLSRGRGFESWHRILDGIKR